MTAASTVWTSGLWVLYCRGREAANPPPSGTVPGMATAHVRARSAVRVALVACLQGPPTDALEDMWLQASGIQYYPVGLSHSALRAAQCHRTSGCLGASWSTLRANLSFGRATG